LTLSSIPVFRVSDPTLAEEIAVGDKVRSYDFEAHDDCYVEGVVRHTDRWLEGCPRYEIDVTRQMSGGEFVHPDTQPEQIFPPRNGTPNWLGGYTNGVRKVTP
jgi:hypothetical protein